MPYFKMRVCFNFDLWVIISFYLFSLFAVPIPWLTDANYPFFLRLELEMPARWEATNLCVNSGRATPTCPPPNADRLLRWLSGAFRVHLRREELKANVTCNCHRVRL